MTLCWNVTFFFFLPTVCFHVMCFSPEEWIPWPHFTHVYHLGMFISLYFDPSWQLPRSTFPFYSRSICCLHNIGSNCVEHRYLYFNVIKDPYRQKYWTVLTDDKHVSTLKTQGIKEWNEKIYTKKTWILKMIYILFYLIENPISKYC